jgi:hypothetical protein
MPHAAWCPCGHPATLAGLTRALPPHLPQAAQEWAALGRSDATERVLALAAPWAAVFEEVAQEADSPLPKRASYCGMVFDVHMARLLAAWALGRQVGGMHGRGGGVRALACGPLLGHTGHHLRPILPQHA